VWEWTGESIRAALASLVTRVMKDPLENEASPCAGRDSKKIASKDFSAVRHAGGDEPCGILNDLPIICIESGSPPDDIPAGRANAG
jgi:hypothetical protein